MLFHYTTWPDHLHFLEGHLLWQLTFFPFLNTTARSFLEHYVPLCRACLWFHILEQKGMLSPGLKAYAVPLFQHSSPVFTQVSALLGLQPWGCCPQLWLRLAVVSEWEVGTCPQHFDLGHFNHCSVLLRMWWFLLLTSANFWLPDFMLLWFPVADTGFQLYIYNSHWNILYYLCF